MVGQLVQSFGGGVRIGHQAGRNHSSSVVWGEYQGERVHRCNSSWGGIEVEETILRGGCLGWMCPCGAGLGGTRVDVSINIMQDARIKGDGLLECKKWL